MKIVPLKKFGQNFLTDKNIIEKIISLINPKHDEFVIEIGPGQGALSESLNERAGKYLAIEIDERAAEFIKEKFGLPVLLSDFLKVDINKMIEDSGYQKIRIAGNIPYNITTPILEKIVKETNYLLDATLMVQLEAAERITSPKGTKDYNAMNLLLNYFAEIKKEFIVSANSFFPKPRVTSAIISMKFTNKNIALKQKQQLFRMVKNAFLSRRKRLKNSLLFSSNEYRTFEPFDKYLLKRPDELSAEDYLNILNLMNSER